MLHKAFRTAALALALFAASCSSENTLVTIGGSVTLDGAPLPDGDILFTPANPQFGSEGAKIKDGIYQATIRPGQSKVQIRASRPVPGKKGPMGEQLIEDYIPARYNDQSNLSIEVSTSQRQHDFQLQSK
jgi:hypothetical protein